MNVDLNPIRDGSRLEALQTMRDEIARRLEEDPPAYVVANLSRELRQVLAEIAELDPPEEPLDETDALAARRAASSAARRATRR